jgi:hypothetical protein
MAEYSKESFSNQNRLTNPRPGITSKDERSLLRKDERKFYNDQFFTTDKSSIGEFFLGSPAKRENVSNLRPEQEPLYQQAVGAGLNRGAGGALGTAADYYRDLLENYNGDINAFSAPELRRYNEDIVPNLSEQFAGMGSGGLSSSGFRNAQVQGGVDLAERLGAIRANLRNQGAAGLSNIGNQGLQSYSQNMETSPGSPGLLPSIFKAGGAAVGSYFGGAAGGQAGAAAGGTLGQGFSRNQPMTNAPSYSPSGYQGTFGSLPNRAF